MQLDSRRQGSAKDYVVQELIHDIVNIKLKPGEKLCEPALCERFGVSRTPFREAELELAQRKLIVVRPKIGTFVSFIDKELVEEVSVHGRVYTHSFYMPSAFIMRSV